MDLEIIPIGTASAPADLDDWLAVKAAAHAVDAPGWPPVWRESELGGLTADFPATSLDRYLVREDGVAVAVFHIANPRQANASVGAFELSVHPAHRRRGIGTALVDVIAAAHKEKGRTRLLSYALVAVPGGAARDESASHFARALGFAVAGSEVRRRLDLAAVDDTAAHAEAKARAGEHHTVLRFCEPVPEEYVTDLAFLKRRLSEDTAVYREGWEPTAHDTASMRGSEEAAAARLWLRPHVAIRDERTGHLVAWSFLSVTDESRVIADQAVTVVMPESRGHRLGALAKLELYRYARELAPNLRYVDTWNDGENVHMIRINEELGFVAVEAGDDVTRDI